MEAPGAGETEELLPALLEQRGAKASPSARRLLRRAGLAGLAAAACLAAAGAGAAGGPPRGGGRGDIPTPTGTAAAAIGLAEARAAPESLTVSGLCSQLECANGEYVRKGVLKSGRAWYAGGSREGKCATEWIYYDPDPRRDDTVPAQWILYGTQRAPWEKGHPKKIPEWDGKEYKLSPESDYHRHAYFETPSHDAAPPRHANWKVVCDPLHRKWTEAAISIIPSDVA